MVTNMEATRRLAAALPLLLMLTACSDPEEKFPSKQTDAAAQDGPLPDVKAPPDAKTLPDQKTPPDLKKSPDQKPPKLDTAPADLAPPDVKLTSDQGSLTKDLVAYYPFSGDANDATSNANHGTVYGATLTSDRHGKANSAYLFDGKNDYISVPHSNAISFTYNQDLTVVGWIMAPAKQVDTSSTGNVILEKWSGGAGFPYAIRFTNQTVSSYAPGRIHASRYNKTTQTLNVAANAQNDGKWHSFAYVRAGAKLLLYVDGSLASQVADLTAGPTENTSHLTIGRRGIAQPTGNPFAGGIDDVRIYRRALSSLEVTALSKM